MEILFSSADQERLRMERSFANEIKSLKLGQGETFYGEGILAVTKALLQSGVSYVGGYQGAPVSHLIDVMVQAKPEMEALGVHVEPCTNEASAAAMLGASIMYPVRGAVTWKSIVGTNVASDALSNLASPGVKGGALIIIGEDYGEGASVIQERSHAYAMKSALWLMDPRPELDCIVRMVEKSFELSEVSNTPVMLELRIRACHVQGSFIAKDNIAPKISSRNLLPEPAAHDYDKLSHPPVTYLHEKRKYDQRMPAARDFIHAHGLNEVSDGRHTDVGIIVQGGMYNALMRALSELGLSDANGDCDIPLLTLNVVYPLVPEEIVAFAERRQAVLVVEEGQPEYIEHEIGSILRRAGCTTSLSGKDALPMAGEYTSEVLIEGVGKFLREKLPAVGNQLTDKSYADEVTQLKTKAAKLLGAPVPLRPPGFCTGCPERPFFAALKMTEKEIGKVHYSADIGCHSFASFAPFSFGNSILGFGMSLSSNAGVRSFQERRPLAVMGDGGFWHNGLLSGVTSRLLNGGDGVLVILKNGYTSATGTQELVSSPGQAQKKAAAEQSATASDRTIEDALKGVGVKWLKTVHTYRVSEMRKTLTEAFKSPFKGLKVIVAEGECQLERQRRIRPLRAEALAAGRRVVRTRFGIDEETCTGDHSCIRLSGCPTLTIKTSSDPLKTDPVAHVTNGCVGCGLCGETAHAATLCPSFWRAEIVSHPGWMERTMARFRSWFTGVLAP
jgi:indolepyruvate ferredoxin oxidoreductase, alpha subunit